MKNRIGLIILGLVVVCIGLGIAVIAIKNQEVKEEHEFVEKSGALSNSLVQTSDQLDRQKQVNTELEKERDTQKKAIEDLTGKYAKLSVNFSEVSTNLAKTEAALKTSQEETAKRDAKIADLEAQNQALDKQATDLTAKITSLSTQIEATNRKLATSEGEKGFLEKELKRMMAEKAELERQFNDLTVLRAQVSKLKEELSVARRLDWIRQGLFASSDQKGAQQLMQGAAAARAKPAVKPAYDLNVEVNADGSVKVIPPLTNRPAATSPPAK